VGIVKIKMTGRGVASYGRSAGFSLPEMLVVIAMIGIAVAIVIPLTAEAYRQARIRSAADQFTVDLRAARMIAVATRVAAPGLDFVVAPDPANYYEYPDNRGNTRRVNMPTGVRIVSSTSPIRFQLNGSLANPATTVLEVDLSGTNKERWTVTTSIMGVPTTTRQRL
jgi:prepilin-type N-terminal cleavage/methylation domain-containing protein